jgi:hypothetical protein
MAAPSVDSLSWAVALFFLGFAEKKKLSIQRASPFGSRTEQRLRLSLNQGFPVQAGSLLESRLWGEHGATTLNPSPFGSRTEQRLISNGIQRDGDFVPIPLKKKHIFLPREENE